MSCDDNHDARAKDREKRRSLPIADQGQGRDANDAQTAPTSRSRLRRSTGAAPRSAIAGGPAPGAANEFAGGTFEIPEDVKNGKSVSRRGFMQVASLSSAMAAVGACAKPHQKIVPFVRRPAEVVPGNALHFATAYGIDGYASGLLVESHEGRPTKIEGNPAHPQTLGATSSFDQNLVLGLYDDDRAKQIRSGARPLAWRTFLAEASVAREPARGDPRGRAALPDRADDVAVPRRSAPPDPRTLPEREVRQLRVAGRRRRGRRGQAWRSASRWCRATRWRTPT